MVRKSEEAGISYIESSPLTDELHPARPKPKLEIPLVSKEASKNG
jgi:hypothetical protein